MAEGDRKLISCYCVCGGWVFASILGHDKESDAEAYREVAKLVKLGFTVENGTVSQFNSDGRGGCLESGKCTTAPHKVKSKDLPLFAEQA